MPKNLRRIYGLGHLHYITFSCYRRLPLLRTPRSRNIFVAVLAHTRERYKFKLVGYVVMPEHVHLLISEPEIGTPSTAIQMLKQRVSRIVCALPDQEKTEISHPLPRFHNHHIFWQKRFYDFNVFTQKKKIEKLHYMHMNPVKRGLVASPEQWIWSSYSAYQEEGGILVSIDSRRTIVATPSYQSQKPHPHKPRVGHPPNLLTKLSISVISSTHSVTEISYGAPGRCWRWIKKA